MPDADVAVKVAVPPTVTLTDTPASLPVSPEMPNPSAFSAMFTVLSTAIALTFRTNWPAAATVTV